MTEHRLRPLTALGGTTPRTDRIGGLTIRENADLALCSVAARLNGQADVEHIAGSDLGIVLPGPGRFSIGGPLRAFWIGPGQWTLEAPYATHENLERQAKAAFQGHASVTEQSDGWAGFEIEGETCTSLFERLCNADIKRMIEGQAVRTTIEHLGCFILCNESRRSFSLRGASSSALSLHHALLTAARSSE